MKIKISDMFDNAAEIIEAEGNYSDLVNSRSVKEIVFQRIHRSRKIGVKHRCIAGLIAVLGASVILVGAKTFFQPAGIIGTNQEDVLRPQEGITIDEDSMSNYRTEIDVQTNLILPENLYDNGIPIAKYILEVSVDEENALPECYVENGTMLIFTNGSNKDGWYADKDTTLQLDFKQVRVEEKETDQAGVLEVGYIYKGKINWWQVTDSVYNSTQLTFDQEGNYYICIRNVSSDRVIITNGSVRKKKVQEE